MPLKKMLCFMALIISPVSAMASSQNLLNVNNFLGISLLPATPTNGQCWQYVSANKDYELSSCGGGGGGSGTVTNFSIVNANGFSGSVSNPTTTPALTLTTTITGLLQGNGTAISAAATGNLTDAGTDGITVTSGTGAVLGSGTSLSQHVSDTTHNGYLASADWNTFNGKFTLPSFTAGSVLFSNGTTIAQDNANFFWDSTNHRLGLGNASPLFPLDIITNTASSAQAVQSVGYGANSNGFRAMRARGTVGSPAAVQNNDLIGFWSAKGFGTTIFPSGATGAFQAVAEATFTDTSMPTDLRFLTTPVGSITASERMRVAPTGDVLIGTTTDGTGLLQVNGVVSATGVNISGLTASLPVFTDGSKNLATQSISSARASLGIDSGIGSFITSGTTYTTPSTTTTNTVFKFTLVGGGGGSAGVTVAGAKSAGGGGAGSCIIWATGISPNTALTIAIGAAGTAGANTGTSGGTGGNTTITIGATTYTASGGVGSAAGNQTNGGVGGTTTNCTAGNNAQGFSGQQGGASGSSSTAASSPNGGSPVMFGQGGPAIVANAAAPGAVGTGFGAGGGGGSSNGTTAEIGAAGTQGVILPEYTN